MIGKRQNKKNFLDGIFSHNSNTATTIGGHGGGKMNQNRELLLSFQNRDDDDDSDIEEDISTFEPMLREEEEDEEFDEITGEKKKRKVRKVKQIKSVEIIPTISNVEAYGEAPHKHLLRPPFSMLIIAPKGSGKSTVSINLEQFYQGAYDNRIVFSPTMIIDDNWKAAFKSGVVERFKKRNTFTKYNEAKLKKIWKAIKKENKTKENYADKLKTMILFDDIIGQLPRTRIVNSMYDIARNHRHYGVSNTVISQEYSGLAPVLRKNATGIILFKTTDGNEIKSVVDAQGGFIGKNRFFRMWAFCISKPYGFLFINKDKSDIKKGKLDGDRYFSKFETELNPMDFSNERVKDMIEELMILNKKDIEEEPKEDKEEPKELKKDINGDGKKEIVIEETPQEDLKICKCKMSVIKDISNICPNGLNLLANALNIENTEDMSKEDLIKEFSGFSIHSLKKVLAMEKKKLGSKHLK